MSFTCPLRFASAAPVFSIACSTFRRLPVEEASNRTLFWLPKPNHIRYSQRSCSPRKQLRTAVQCTCIVRAHRCRQSCSAVVACPRSEISIGESDFVSMKMNRFSNLATRLQANPSQICTEFCSVCSEHTCFHLCLSSPVLWCADRAKHTTHSSTSVDPCISELPRTCSACR